MEGEEKNNVGLKRRAKQIEIGLDSDDDEPIGYFLKLKSKRNPNKNKVVSDGGDKGKGVEKCLVEDEDLVGMDDTLASFRKKLRVPKKVGPVLRVGGDLSTELPVSVSRPISGGDLATKDAGKVKLEDDDDDDGYAVDKELGAGPKRKSRRSKVALALKNVGADFESKSISDSQRYSDSSSQNEKDVALGSGEGSIKCLDEHLDDSLSAFLQKAQCGLIGKSRSSLRSKLGKETQGFSDGVLEDIMPDLTRKFRSASKLANEIAESNEDSHLVCARGMVDSVLMDNKTDDILEGNFSCSNSRQELRSAPLITHDNCRSGDNANDTLSEGIPENSVPMSVLQRSQSNLKACSDILMNVQVAEFTAQTQMPGTLEHCVGERRVADFPVAVTASEELESHNFYEGSLAQGHDNVQNPLLNFGSSNDASKSNLKICSTVGKEFPQVWSDHESLNSSHEDKFPSTNKKAGQENFESLASQVEESNTFTGKIDMADNSHHGLDSGQYVQYSGQEWILSTVDAPRKIPSTNDYDGPNQVLDNCTGEPCIASVSLEKEDILDGSLSPVSACGTTKYEFAPWVKQHDISVRHGGDSNQFSQAPNDSVDMVNKCNYALYRSKSFDGVSKDASIPSIDYFSGEEEAKGAFSPRDVRDSNDSYAEDTGQSSDPGSKNNNITVGEHAARKPRKRRLGDMAYEGDADWEILIHEQDYFIGHQGGESYQSSKMSENLNSSLSSISEAENRGAAAISAGLRARVVGPVEKIKFKEVFKRKGGLQEYLECRNNILSLWNKDVSRILPLSDCGVSDTPLVDESPHAVLVRDIYAFLDQCGYINFGVVSEKAENGSARNLKLLKKENFVERSGAPVADANDGFCYILGRVANPESSRVEKNDIALEDEKQVVNESKIDQRRVDFQAVELAAQTEHEEFPSDNYEENGVLDVKIPGETDKLGSNTSIEDEKSRILCVANPDLFSTDEAEVGRSLSGSLLQHPEDNSNLQSTSSDGRKHFSISDLDNRKRIVVVGAGPAGLTAARHLQRQGFHVTVLEGRSRIGGRVFTDRSSLSVPVDLGASIITGVEADVATERRADPSSLVCAQLGLELTVLNSDCPLYDTVTGQKVPADLDEALEAEYNSLLDDMVLLVAQKGENALRMSLEDGLEYALKRRRMARCGRNLVNTELPKSLDNEIAFEKVFVDDEVPEDANSKTKILAPLERRVMDWHFANLEYGCAALLKEVSLPYWNQDDIYGGFGGAHCMIKGGYGTVIDSLGGGLSIHLNHVVTDIRYTVIDAMSNDDQCKVVKVITSNGLEFSADAVLITVPLGCLKAETIKFSPPLPQWKHLSIQRLGFGVLNKVVMEFSEVFWDDSIDYFGATAEETNQRGWCFMFWNVKKTVGAPVLIALVVGKAAIDGQNMSSSDHVNHALLVLRKLFGETAVPDPVASVVTDWGRDPYSYGAYSYVAVGSSGEDYDLIGRPVENCLFFAGEATCKEHPDTVGGAMMSGLREAVRIIDILNTGTDYTAEADAIQAAKRHSDIERSEIRDIINRLEAIELSNVLYKNSLDQTQILTKENLLKDLFYNAKTTAGRLHVAKQLLKLPVQVLKSFAGNRKGLSMLNSWMLDSMGKDRTQLLRHCVRLLVLVSTDLLAVRLSGIGKTVKEKVCVHTSRDIRAIASQLVNVWIEIFRKEKASNGRSKLLRQPTGVDSFKSKSFQDPGKPPLRTNQIFVENRGSLKVLSSRNHLASSAVSKKLNMEVKPSSSQGSVGRKNATGEENKEFPSSEEEKAAFAAAEAARAAALAAEEAYASSGAKSLSLQLPKIPSFHKFARREEYARMDESDIRRNWSGNVYGKQDCLSEIDSRNCRVRDWSVDFSAAGVNLDTSKMSVDNRSQHSHSNEIACQLNFREHSGESVAVDSSLFTKAWVDSAGSVGTKDYNAIERWQCQAAAANSDFFHITTHITDEEDSTSKLPTRKQDGPANESSASQVTVNKEVKNQPRGAERIKQAVVDYVASLLMPLYKARKIDREGYKTIMKKTATKVMEQATDAEKAMAVFEFLDSKRKNKIRPFVDKLIERHMAMKPDVKS